MTLFDMRDDGVESGSMIEFHKEIGKPGRSVYWTEPNLTFLRVRFISDRFSPMWDMSYAYGIIGKDTDHPELVNVSLPSWQIYKKNKNGGWQHPKKVLIDWANKDNVYLGDRGFWDAVSFCSS